jgi:ubiquinone/menaquinone biosynthesis C-methylase UbiE
MAEVDRYDVEASFYDVLFDKVDDIPLYQEYARKYEGPVLECGCGTGRVAIALARIGINVVGIDTNEKMLAIAHKKLAKEPSDVKSRVKLAKADMRSFKLEEQFSLCIIPFSTFLHMLTVNDQEACLSTINQHLLPEGRLIISVFNPDLSRPQDVVRLQRVKQVGNELIMRFFTQSFDFPNQITFGRYIYDFVKSDGTVKRLVVPFTIRYIFYDEMRQLLARTGYEAENIYGDEKKSPFQPNSPLMVFVARKSKLK